MSNTDSGKTKRNQLQKIKCIVWDLDNTIWNGVLLEDTEISVREGMEEIIKEFDRRGILQSIASKNEYNVAIQKLKDLGLDEYFIYPQINWSSKSSSIRAIAHSINIGLDTIAFIDDQPFEREEVRYSIPEVLCIDAAEIETVLQMPEMNPLFITEDSKHRRLMYISGIQRANVEENFIGTQEEFLASLEMYFSISPVGEGDLQRAEELTVRTNQLNTTGYTYSYEELDSFRRSDTHKLLIAGLKDKYGSYGKVGIVLLECSEDIWCIKLFLMSCRVMSRGVGTMMLNHIMSMALKAGVKLRAEFISNDRNRMMYITYKFAGFKEVEEKDNLTILENNLEQIQPIPEYVRVEIRV